ncbi:TPA: acyltransferase, partial [Raoultella ornithinolytica]|nr:acyltransferase [Raoultella ornithinolytica]
MAEEKKSIIGIQYLRAYAAILVVINHFCNNDIYIFNLLRFDIIGGFGVDIFFIISGFIMAYTLSEFSSLSSKQTAISFIKKRIMR